MKINNQNNTSSKSPHTFCHSLKVSETIVVLCKTRRRNSPVNLTPLLLNYRDKCHPQVFHPALTACIHITSPPPDIFSVPLKGNLNCKMKLNCTTNKKGLNYSVTLCGVFYIFFVVF